MLYLVNITPFHYETEPDLSRILEQIAYCKKSGCEVVIAAMHWGLEFETYPHITSSLSSSTNFKISSLFTKFDLLF